MSEVELLQAQVRMTAMHAAITVYCCDCNCDNSERKERISPGHLHELLPLLLELRNILLETTRIPSPGNL